MTRKITKDYKKTKIIVTGAGHFPTDMLRFDSCVPMSNRDIVLIESYSTSERVISLARFSHEGTKATRSKWLSYGWNIIYDEGV